MSTLFFLPQNRLWMRRNPLLLGVLLLLSVFQVSTVRAAGTVTQPTEAALNSAIQGGGLVTFACDGVIHLTHTKKVGPGVDGGDGTTDLTLDATGHNITLDGSGSVQFLSTTTIGRLGGNNPYSLTLKHLTLSNGYADGGGAIYADANTTLTLSDCTFVGNRAGSSGGGALYAIANPAVIITNCTFLNNQASGPGGAIGIDCNFSRYNINVTNTAFSGNSVTTPASGGIAQGGAMFLNCNDALTLGGSCTLTNCAFLNNRITAGANTGANGGALVMSTSTGTLNNCTFVGNSATSGSTKPANGGALYTSYGLSHSYSLVNCTLAKNAAVGGTGGTGNGGGLYNNTDGDIYHRNDVNLTNTIVANNTASTSGGDGYGVITDGGHNICSDGSCGFTSATSMNNTDPRLGPLVYPGNATPALSLLGGSPAIDAGDDSKAPTTDQRGATVQGAHRDIGAYERPVWQADAVATDANNNTVLLWNHNQGYVSLWNVNSCAGNPNGQWLYGPYEGWTCIDMAVGADNKARLLWRYTDGRLAIWGVNASTGAVLYQRGIGAEAGWTGMAIRVGGDGNARLAWRYMDGRICVWTLDENTGTRLNAPVFTPSSGSTFADIVTAANNRTTILWNNADGTQSVRTADANGSPVSSYTFGPYLAWTATRLSVGGDNNLRLLWNHLSGYVTLWSVNSSTGSINNQALYGSYSGWNGLSLATGTDNNTRLLWNHIGGYDCFWNVDSALNVQNQFLYGPYN